MTTAVQRRRGTNTEHASFTGLEGEISVNTTNESVHVHDGSTAGGFELMRADGSNSSVSLGDITGVTAGTGLSGGGTSGDVTLNIDSTVATLAGTQTFTNKTLTSPILNTPTIGTSFTIGGATITEAELEILDGATVTTTELNYVDGVTSSIQTQIDAKAPLASPTFTGTVTMSGLTVDTDTLYVDSTNNRVGIGTTTVNADLHINKSSGAKLWITAEGSNPSDAGSLRFSELSDGNNYFEFQHNGNANKLNLTTTNGDLVTFDRINQRVGIGTTSPSEELELASSSPTIRLTDTNDSTYGSVSYNVNALLLNGDNTIRCSTGGSERMRIDSSGNVGIGGGTISSKLFINTDTVGDSYFRGGADNSRQLDFSTFATASPNAGHKINATSVNGQIAFATGGTERMRIDSSGNLLVGTTASSSSGTGRITAKGLANGSIYTIVSDQSAYGSGTIGHIRFLNSNGAVGQIQTSGSSTSYNTSSDYRLKENVVELTGATERLKQLNPSRFNFIADADTTVDGFLAHEVADVVPEAISGEKDAVDADGNPEYQGIDQSKLVPLLVATIQELEARITQLENN